MTDFLRIFGFGSEPSVFQTAEEQRRAAQYQAAMWQGAGEVTGLKSPPETFLTTFDARVKFTADVLGMKPTDVLKRVVRGEMPLLSTLPAAAVGAGVAYGATRPHETQEQGAPGL